MAGGLTEAAGSEVLIVRSARGSSPDTSFVAAASTTTVDPASGEAPAIPAGSEIVEVNLTRLLESGDAGLVVRPGDVVQVPPAKMVYVAGEVNRPGGFTLTAGEPITVLQAVALAEGLGPTAASGRSVIVRQREDGGKEEIPVDLEAVLEGEEAAPLLEPSDVLFVPNNDTKSVALGVIDAFVRMFTLRGLIY
jgi:polysaccharide export outer membrane protein